MAHGDAREGKWRGNWRMEWVPSTLHATSEHGVSSITTADAHTSAASSRMNWSPRRFKWTRPFRQKTKSGFCACAITFQTQSSSLSLLSFYILWFISCSRNEFLEERLTCGRSWKRPRRAIFTFEHKDEILILSPWPFCNLSRTSPELTN